MVSDTNTLVGDPLTFYVPPEQIWAPQNLFLADGFNIMTNWCVTVLLLCTHRGLLCIMHTNSYTGQETLLQTNETEHNAYANSCTSQIKNTASNIETNSKSLELLYPSYLTSNRSMATILCANC